MIMKTNAKINLSLDVLAKRKDGYHDLQSIMQEIPLCDTIYVEKSENITVSNNIGLPNDETNIAYKAAKAFFSAAGTEGGATIHLEKQIPLGAGLGGGSANGAGVLKALQELYAPGLSEETLLEAAAKVGADVPFFLKGSCCFAEGIGEILTPCTPLQGMFLLLLKPPMAVNTGMIFRAYDETEPSIRPDHLLLLRLLKEGDSLSFAKNMVNTLEEVTVRFCPEIAEMKNHLLRCGADGAMMSGSGSTVFGLFTDKEKAEIAQKSYAKPAFTALLTL